MTAQLIYLRNAPLICFKRSQPGNSHMRSFNSVKSMKTFINRSYRKGRGLVSLGSFLGIRMELHTISNLINCRCGSSFTTSRVSFESPIHLRLV